MSKSYVEEARCFCSQQAAATVTWVGSTAQFAYMCHGSWELSDGKEQGVHVATVHNTHL
jgi:hypothetical protein